MVITLNDTHQQTKRLVDPVNGTYQTVLTIDPSVGQSDIVGTYNCTVENDRGESSETVVVPGETCSLAYFLACHPYIFIHFLIFKSCFCTFLMLISVTVRPKPKKNISFKCNHNLRT